MKAVPGSRSHFPCTLIKFRIVAPLYQLHEQTVRFRVGTGFAFAHFSIVNSGMEPTWTGVGATASIPGDDLGVLHNTIVELVFPGLADMSPPTKVGGIPLGQE